MKVAIFGSCVSRDTAEFMPEVEVVAYVARHSVTSLQSPHGTAGIDLSDLTSAFQKRMVTSDLKGSGIDRIVKNADDLDVVLLDLVDERRGFWKFPDGSTMTHSIEVESCGAARLARREGARLIEFGTDEHFSRWRAGFKTLITRLKAAGLWERTILLDIEWAAALEGSRFPQQNIAAQISRKWMKIHRATRIAKKSWSNGDRLQTALTKSLSIKTTDGESFMERAIVANKKYVRYRKEARDQTRHKLNRPSRSLRIGPNHRWGPQPFHYRTSDYISIADEIVELEKGFPE